MGVTPDEIINFEKTEDHTFLIWLHLSVMLGYVMPLGNVILPLILWLTNKNKVQYTDEQGKNILNFQIIYSAIIFLLLFFGALGKILHTDLVTFGNVMISFEVTLVIVFLLGTINFFFPIINAIRISKGTVKNFYPTIIRFIK